MNGSKQSGYVPHPIAPASLAQSLRLSDVAWDGEGETLVWLEGRSDRGVLVCQANGQAPRDLTTTLSVRARVGYGGGDFAVADGTVYFVAQEGRLYWQSLQVGYPQPLTPEFGHIASPAPSPDSHWVVYVYTYEGKDGLAIVDTGGKMWPQILVSGEDFYMQPRWHRDSRRIAWVSWNHPNMPWDSTMLKIAALDTHGPALPTLAQVETLVDKPDVAVAQPEFSPDGRWLAYLSDESGWTNLYLYDLQARVHRQLTDQPVDIGTPAWAQGVHVYGWGPDSQCIYYVRNEAGFSRLWAYDLASGRASQVESPLGEYTELAQIALSPGGRLACVASSSTVSARVVSCPARRVAGEHDDLTIYRRSSDENTPPADLSTPEPVHWTAPDGTTVHGLYYPPTSACLAGTACPPAIVNIHGGPTSQVRAGYNGRAQFFATRGYAYLEVNYRGSTGYGKRYMAALRQQWGILDVEDAVGGARYLADAGLADPRRMVIMGGSAGGYTVLQTLANRPGAFRAGVCLYGVSSLFALAAETHKFEERYLDSMIGPLPEASAAYRERSPIFYADRIVDPIIVFQGEIDRVVPRSQSDEIVASLRQRGVPHEYHVYEGEGHGWRKTETIEAFYKAVEAFLKQYVLFA